MSTRLERVRPSKAIVIARLMACAFLLTALLR